MSTNASPFFCRITDTGPRSLIWQNLGSTFSRASLRDKPFETKKKDVSRSDHAIAFGDAIKSNLYPCCIVLG